MENINSPPDMLSGSILIERQLKIMEIYSGDGNVKIHLELADNSVFVFKLFLRLLSSVEIKSLKPLRESFKLRLALQLIGVNLQNNVRSQTSFLQISKVSLLYLEQSHLGLDPLPLNLWTQLGSPNFSRSRRHRLQRN